MPEYRTPSGLLVVDRRSLAPDEIIEGKANRIDQASIRPGLTGGQVVSRFRDFNSYLHAITIPWVWPCVSVIAYNFANTPVHLINSDGEVDDALDEGELLTLLRQPNPFQNGFEFLEQIAQYLELTGNSYVSLEERDGSGKPRQLYLPTPARMRVIPDPERFIRGYAYDVSGNSQAMAVTSATNGLIGYDPDEIIHIKWVNPNDAYYGLGNVEASPTLYDLVAAMQQHELSYWLSGGRIVGVLETDSQLSDTEFDRLRTHWRLANSDAKNRVRIAILEQGLKYTPIAEGLRSLDLVNIDKSKRDQMISIFGVPLPKLGIMENAAYKLVDADQYFWGETMDPKFTRAEYGLQPLVELFHPGRRLQFERRNFEDDTAKMTNAGLMQALNSFSVNEIRTYLGVDPLPGPEGEVIWTNTQMTPIRLADYAKFAEQSAEEPPPPETPAEKPPETPAAPVRLADHVKAWADLSPLEQIETEDRLLTRRRGTKAARRPAETPLARVRAYTGTKKVARASRLPDPPTRVSGRAPALAVAITRDRDRYAAPTIAAAVPRIRAAFRKQQSAITRSGTLTKVVGAARRWYDGTDEKAKLPDKVEEALRAVWKSEPLTDALAPIYAVGVPAGAAMMARVIPGGKRARTLGERDTKAADPQDFPGLGARISTRWQSIDDTTLQSIKDQVSTGIERGYSPLQIANGYADENYDGIQGVFANASDVRAETIARTECLVGETPVLTTAPLVRAYRRLYDGEVIRLRTARGHELTATPNHPILTDKGWVAAGLLREGDHVLSRGARDGVAAGHPDVQHIPPTIAEVFDALAVVSLPERKLGSPVDFHGDGAEGEVDVVGAAGNLRDYARMSADQIGQFRLALTDMPGKVGPRRRSLSSLFVRLGLSRGQRPRRAPWFTSALEYVAGVVERHTEPFRNRVQRQALAVERDHFGGRHFQFGSLAPEQGSDAALVQDAADHGLTDAERSSNLPPGFAGLVAPDNIVSVDRGHFAGHVYNLETENGAYVAADIIAHNCMNAYNWGSLAEGADMGVTQFEAADGDYDAVCLPSGEIVEAFGVTAPTSRWHEGQLVVLSGPDGVLLTATPNHPVLTPDGFVPAGELMEGDQVIRCTDLRSVLAVGVVTAGNDYYGPRPVEQIMNLAKVPRSRVAVEDARRADDFHSKRRPAEIQVPDIVRVLRDGVGQELSQEFFVAAAETAARLASKGGAAQIVEVSGDASHRGMSRSRPGQAAFSAESGHMKAASVRGVAEAQSRGHQAITQPSRGVPEIACQSVDGGSGLITIDEPTSVDLQRSARGGADGDAPSNEGCPKVVGAGTEARRQFVERLSAAVEPVHLVKVERREFSGQVYNLHTVPGWYLANGLIVHNCADRNGQIFDADSFPEDHPNGTLAAIPVFATMDPSADPNADPTEGASTSIPDRKNFARDRRGPATLPARRVRRSTKFVTDAEGQIIGKDEIEEVIAEGDP